jgi:5'-methylthioadenosine phosphorylase
LGDVLEASCRVADVKTHRGGTYLCMEGPAFSTVAESNVYRSWGMDIIGMTNLQEAKLAREAELCFATLALATDYDCWRTGHADVQIDEILRVIAANVELARKTVAALAGGLPDRGGCRCASALRDAIVTDRTTIPDATRRALTPIAGKYL